MPPFPERESSLLAKLYQTAPWTAKLHQEDSEEGKQETPAVNPVATTPPPAQAGMANGPLVTTQQVCVCVCVCVCTRAKS